MIELLQELVEIESPTRDTADIRDRLAHEPRAVAGDVEVAGDHLLAHFAGVYDMKGGIVVMLEAIRIGQTERALPGNVALCERARQDGRALGLDLRERAQLLARMLRNRGV